MSSGSQPQEFDADDIFEYDYNSIMHYGCYNFSANPGTLKTLEPKDADVGCAYDFNYAYGFGIGQREKLSPGDIETANWHNLDDWVVAYTGAEGSTPWTQISEEEIKLKDLRFADMNNNGTTDIISTQYGALAYKEAGNANAHWNYLGYLSSSLSDIALGDFNGNGTTDVLWADGTRWRLKEAGVGHWYTLNYSGLRVKDLAFGDFNGNGTMDAFVASGSKWYYYEAGWSYRFVDNSSRTLWNMAFGDFNGSGKTDVFFVENGTYYYREGGKGIKIPLQSSSHPFWALEFGDFNADGKTDIARISDDGWMVSYSGYHAWQALHNMSTELPPRTKQTWGITNTGGRFGVHNRLWALGDFDGNGSTDIFQALKWF